MTLPRTKMQIQTQWRHWFDGYAVSVSMDPGTKGETHAELAREIAWMLLNGNLEQDITRRIAKIDGFVTASIDPLSFDNFWMARYALLTWMLT